MIVTKIKNLIETSRHIHGEGFESIRAILADDGMGFSVHKTIIPKSDTAHNWHYKEHLEACYCISGRGILKNLDSGDKYEIAPDTIYLLDKHDNHTFLPIEDTVLISIFNPPVYGNEVHDENRSYVLPLSHNRDVAEKIYASIQNINNKYDTIETIQDILNGKL